MSNEEITDQEVHKVMADFCPCGYLDIKAAISTAREAGKHDSFIFECCEEFCGDTETKISDVDVNYCVWDSLHQEARQEIEEATEIDICNDEPYDSCYVCGNYMCTSFDGYDSEAFKALKEKVIKAVGELSPVLEWFFSEVEE